MATGVDAFRWFPDGKRIAFVSWVWPDAEGRRRAGQAAARHFSDRKETGYATSEAMYRYWDHSLPMGRAPQLHVMDVDSGRARNVFEGSGYELERAEPDTNTFDISPDGKRIVFAFDPADEKRFDEPLCAGRARPEERPLRRDRARRQLDLRAHRATAPTARRSRFAPSTRA